jgi:serine phosphatase RsbU (regulator of sigma subunit)
MKKTILIFIYSILLNTILFSQTNIDSLLISLNSEKSDTNNIKTLIYIVNYYLNTDTAEFNKYNNKLIKLVEKNEEIINPKWYASIIYFYIQSGNFEKSTVYYHKIANIHLEQNNLIKYIYTLNDLGSQYSNYGYHEKSIETLLNILNFIEEKNLDEHIARTYLLLGFAYRNYQKYDQSLEYFFSCLKSSDTNDINSDAHYAYNEIGNVYFYKKYIDSSLYYHNKALKIREKIGDSSILAYSYNDIANDYENLNQLNYAKFYYLKSSTILEKTKNIFNVSIIYSNLARLLINTNNLDSAKIFLDKELNLAKNSNNKTQYQTVYYNLSKYYYMKFDFENAYNYLELSNNYKDSIFLDETNSQIADLEKKYEIEKRDNQIIKVNEQLKRQQILTISFIIVILLILFFSVIIYKQLKDKKIAFTKLEQQNQEILQQKEEITQQKEEIEFQSNTISIQNKHFTDSINYANRIQQALFPPNELFDELLKEYFVFFSPKDIVSGDFYWISKLENKILLTVGDCTGHGVPGAFMSVLSISLLNEIKTELLKNEIYNYNSATILDKLKEKVMISLRQTGKENEAYESIDMSFCIIDPNNNTINFAGAYNSIYIIRNEQLIELKADRMPVGIAYLKNNKFNNTIFQYQKNDILYLFTDGMADQFGGNKNEKLSYKRFKELLVSISKQNIIQQKELLFNYLNNWNKSSYQTDDITIIGLRL